LRVDHRQSRTAESSQKSGGRATYRRVFAQYRRYELEP
jgi:hypothetical protein